MYAVSRSLPIDELGSGSFLLSGPGMSGKHDVLLDLIAEGLDNGEGALVVTTSKGANQIITDLENRLESFPPFFRIVDCVSDRLNEDSPLGVDQIEFVSSPGDLTGAGIGITENLRELTNNETLPVRIGFYSISSLLMYNDLETVFRFLHVLVGRISAIDGLGIFVVDPTTHDESTVNTIKQLFSGIIELRTDEATRQVRLVGVEDTPTEWVSQ